MGLRKTLFWIHLAIGCAAGVVILTMCVTGVLLAYQRQIISWVEHGSRSTQPSGTSTALPIEKLLARIPPVENHAAPTAITLRSDPSAPAEFSFGRERVFLVDVYSGRVLGEGSARARSFFDQLEDWHRWLGASTEHRPMGRAVTGACNLGFLLLVISGPFLWLPRKWSWQNVKAVLLFRRGLSGRARDFNWHNVIGVWCAVPLFLIVLSGVVMSYPWANNLLYRITGNDPPVQGNGQRQEGGRAGRGQQPGFNASGLNLLWTRAEQQVPAWRSITVRLPPSARVPLTFNIDAGNGGRPDQRSQLTLDRKTGDIIRWEPFSSYNAGRRWRSWFRFLHTGEAGGIAGETVAAIASAGAALLAWTGIWLACRRLARWRRRAPSSPSVAKTYSAAQG